MAASKNDMAASYEVLGESRCRTRQAVLYELASELLKTVWKLRPMSKEEEERIFAFSEPKYTFVEQTWYAGYEVVVHLIVTQPLANSEVWTQRHTCELERLLHIWQNEMKDPSQINAAVVVVDGAVDPEVLKMNLRENAESHVIESVSLTNADLEHLPQIVCADDVCIKEGLTAITELPRITSASPEVQLLRAKISDVIAYPPTPFMDGLHPSGQVADWVARIVVL